MVEIPPHLHGHLTDSAGQPWAGRTFSDNPWQDDDGSAPESLLTALAAFHAGEAPSSAVIDALREVRLLVPLVAELGEAGTNEQGMTVDKSADLSIVTVAGPDGRGIVPVFSSTAAMQRWDAQARPVPVDARRAALATVEEQTDLLILDPGSDTEFVVRRPAVWAIAQGDPYLEPWRDQVVLDSATALLDVDPRIQGIDLRPGDPQARFAGPELEIVALIADELDAPARQELLASISERISSNAELVTRIDSLALAIEQIAAGGGSTPGTTPGQPVDSGESTGRRGFWRRNRR